MRSDRTPKGFLCPRIQTLAFRFRKHGRLRMNAWVNTQHDLAGVGALRRALEFLAGSQVIINGLLECRF